MPASEAQVRANQANASKSTGPKTFAGKERSRANAFKHGLTGAGVVLPAGDVAEIERRTAAYREELQPSGEVGLALVRRAATLSVRMERSVEQESAAIADRIRQALGEFEAPEGVDAVEADRLRLEAARRATFDPSREATLARRYEAAAERGFFRALKELRQVEKQAKLEVEGPDVEAAREELGSFLQEVAGLGAMGRQLVTPPPPMSTGARVMARPSTFEGRVDVPFTIGRSR